MTWAVVAASVVSAGAGIYGANQAGKAGEKAADQNAALAQQNLLVQLGIIEPQRALGYGAQSDLASLYGYTLPDYKSGAELMNPAAGSAGPINVNGRAAKDNLLGAADPFGIVGGKADKKYGGTIDPRAGTVVVNGSPELSAKYTEYLRTGNLGALGGKAIKKNSAGWRIFSSIENLRSSGWKYDPEAAKGFDPMGGSGKTTPPGGTGAGGYDKTPEGTSADGTAGNMSRFFASPDYNFRLNETTRAIDRSAAARSGAVTGNVIKANSERAGDLASAEYGDYVNRLLAMAGLGQTANAQAAGAANNATAGVTAANTQAGDARASGVLGMTNSVANAVNSGVNNYAMLQYIKKQPASVIQPAADNWT